MSLKNLALSLLTTIALSLVPNFLLADPPLKKIGITQLVQHEAADLVREGIIEALRSNGYEDGKTAKIIYENAQGNLTTATQIARNFSGMDLDIVIPITTVSAQTVVKAMHGKNVPIVFSAVTDPVKAGLVKGLNSSDEHVTGVRDMPPIANQIAFIKRMLPGVKTVGVLYNPGDEGSTTSLQTIHAEAKKNGLTIVEAPATRSVDVKGAMESLIGKVDAVYIPLDNTVVSAMRTVSQLAVQANIPLFSADSGSVVDGAFACLGHSYLDHGRQAGQIAAAILEGKPVKSIPVQSPDKEEVYINLHISRELDVVIPKDIASRAKFL